MFHPNKKNVNAKFGPDFDMAISSNSHWTLIPNVHSLKKGNITYSHISFTSPLYHRIQALPYLLQ